MRWTVRIAAAATGAPVVAPERTIVPLQPGEISGRRLSDGGEVWKAPLGPVQPLEMDGGRILVATADAVHAIDAADGSVAWQQATGKPTAPLLARDGWVFAAADGHLIAIRGSDGARVWNQALGPMTQRPALDGDRLFVPVEDGRVAALDVKTGTILWQVQTGDEPAEPLAVASRVYLGSGGRFLCLRASDGEVDWERRVGARVLGRPAADDARVYFTAMDNVLRAIGRASGSIRWNASLPYRPVAGPVLLGIHVTAPGLVRELRGFSPSTGKESGKLTLPEILGAPPAFVEAAPPELAGIIAITTNDRNEWHLVLIRATPPLPPALPSAPLTELPGLVLPIVR